MKIILSILFTFFSLSSYSISPREAYTMVLRGEAVLIDVREMDEISSGMIDQAMWFPKSQMVPGSEIINDFKNFTKDKKVFVYCQSGKRAKTCKGILKKEGVDAESLGGFKDLRFILPVKTLYQRVNDPFKDTEVYNKNKKTI